MAIELTDDGALGTVLRCSNCGEEMCYYFDPDAPGVAAEGQEEESYNAFVESCIEYATADHECPNDPDAEPTEPQEGDITSVVPLGEEDGKRVLDRAGKLKGDSNAEWYASALKKLTEWPSDDLPGLFDFLKSIWWAADWGWHEEDTPDGKRTRYNISTAGWSGNEDAIRAFGDNVCAWSMAWQSMRRGGHYVFEIWKKG
jgi:hypothetical protein